MPGHIVPLEGALQDQALAAKGPLLHGDGLDLDAHGVVGVEIPLEHLADRRDVEAGSAKGADRLQAHDVRLGVAPVPGVGHLGRRQDSLIGIEADRLDRDARAPRQLADLQGLVGRGCHFVALP